MNRIELIGVEGVPEVKPGDNLIDLIGSALRESKEELFDGDVLVVAQKIVSKSENRVVRLETIEPSLRAKEWAAAYDKVPRVVEVVLR